MKVNIVIKSMRRVGTNYLATTIDNLDRAGVGASAHLASFGIQDGTGLTLHQNAQRAIARAAAPGADYAMVLEDDLDFVDDFLENALAWVENHPDELMYVLGANYAQIQAAMARGRDFWPYPVTAFYGAQALVWHREDAEELAKWLGPDPSYNGITDHGHDLKLQAWGKHRGATHFIASAPSMVQHIGRQSGIGNRFFQFESFPGHEWVYKRRTAA